MRNDAVEVAGGTVVRAQPLLASGTCAVRFNAETAQQKKEGLFLTLRLVDGPNGTPTGWGLAPKNGYTFDHPNGSGWSVTTLISRSAKKMAPQGCASTGRQSGALYALRSKERICTSPTVRLDPTWRAHK